MMESTAAFDQRMLETLYSLRDPAGVASFALITHLGGTIMVGALALGTALYLLGTRRIAELVGLSTALIGTIVSVSLLKELIARARPEALYHAIAEESFAFPSGHAAFSIALYGFLAYLIWKHAPGKIYRYIAISGAALLVALIGFSRLYLGVHVVSDVVAGYAVGGTLLSLGIAIAERLRRNPVWS